MPTTSTGDEYQNTICRVSSHVGPLGHSPTPIGLKSFPQVLPTWAWSDFWTNFRDPSDDPSLKNIAPGPQSHLLHRLISLGLGPFPNEEKPSKQKVCRNPLAHIIHPHKRHVKLPRLKSARFRPQKPRSGLYLFESIFFAGFVANGLDWRLFRAPWENANPSGFGVS